jgi:hypothetical protein
MNATQVERGGGMAEWTQCTRCQLKHAVRLDGLCPRCRQPGVGVPPAAPPPVYPGPAAPEPLVAYPVAEPFAAGQAIAPEAFSVGSFLSSVFFTWFRNAGLVIPVAVVLAAPVAVAMYRMYARMAIGPGSEPPFVSPVFLIPLAIGLLATPLELLSVARAGLRRLRSEPVELGDMLATGARRYFPALALLILVGLACAIPALTIIGVVLSIFLLTAWAASIPAMIQEGLGPLGALGRSWELTRGRRLQLFAGFVVVFAVLIAVSCVLQSIATVTVLVAVGASGGGVARSGTSLGALQAMSALMQGLEGSVLTTATAVAYHQLRIAAEGPATEQLTRVFE